MNLRLRLIVVFFLLSVVPVGAVTYYTYASNAQAIRDAASSEAAQLAGELSQRMRAVTTQLSQRVETLMELPPPAETRSAASEPRAAAVVPKPAPAPAPPVAPAAPAVVQPEMAELDLKLGELAELINNIEIRGQRGPRRFGPPPEGRVPGRPEGGPFVAPAPPGPPAASPGSPASPNAPASAGIVPPAPAGPPNGPPDGFERGGRSRPPPEARGAGEPVPGQVDDPEDPKRIRIDLRLVRRELFNELVADREAFDALPLEEKQKVFAQIEQRMAGVAQGIKVLQKELASRAVDVRTQDAAAAAASGATCRPRPRPAVAATPSTAPAPAPKARAGSRPHRANRPCRSCAGRSWAGRATAGGQGAGARDETIDADVGQAPRGQGRARWPGRRTGERRRRHDEAARDGVREDLARARRGAICRRRRRRAVHADAGGEAAAGGAAHVRARRRHAPGTTVLPDWIVATTTDPTGSGLKFGIARPMGDALVDLRTTSARNAALGLGFIGLALIVIVPLSAGLTRNLNSLSAGVHRIAEGDYSARVPVRSKDEMGRLAVAFNHMAADVEQHQKSAVSQERIRRELELGRQIQHDMLPQASLTLGLTEIRACRCRRAKSAATSSTTSCCATAASRCSSATSRARASARRC